MTNPAATSQNRTPPIFRGGWLDALRFIVASLMVVHHYEAAGPVPLTEYHPVFERGYLLTNFFLIDSGYVLARIYGAKIAAGRMGLGEFFAKRFWRLVPAHLFMATTLVGLVLLADMAGVSPRNPEWFDWSQLPAQVLLVQSYGVPGGIGWNAPTWSISALLGCYLAFPSFLRLVRRLNAWQALALLVGTYGLAHLLALHFLGFPVYRMPLMYGFFRALPLFMAGVLLARVSDTLYLRPALAAAMGLAAAAAIVLLQAYGEYSLITLALIGTIIVAAAAIPLAKPSRLVEQAALASFAVFISNEVVRIGWFGVVNAAEAKLGLGLPLQWTLWALGHVAALAFGFAFYAWFDRPTQAWVKNDFRIEGLERLRRAVADRMPRPVLESLDEPARPEFIEIPIRKGAGALGPIGWRSPA